MSDDYARVLNIVGLAFNLIGVLMLFRWGMPFRVQSRPPVLLLNEQIEPKELTLDHIYAICGWVGLGCLLVGFALQIIAQLLPPTPLPPAKP
jgi:hypothetical protein